MKVNDILKGLKGAEKAAFKLGREAGKNGKVALDKTKVLRSFGSEEAAKQYYAGFQQGKDERQAADDHEAWLEKVHARREGRHYHESLDHFRKDLHNRVKANAEADAALSRQHKWKFEVGTFFMSTKTWVTYEITGRRFQKRIDRDENFKKVGEAYLAPVYMYKSSDGGSGQFWEKELVASKTLKKISNPRDVESKES